MNIVTGIEEGLLARVVASSRYINENYLSSPESTEPWAYHLMVTHIREDGIEIMLKSNAGGIILNNLPTPPVDQAELDKFGMMLKSIQVLIMDASTIAAEKGVKEGFKMASQRLLKNLLQIDSSVVDVQVEFDNED